MLLTGHPPLLEERGRRGMRPPARPMRVVGCWAQSIPHVAASQSEARDAGPSITHVPASQLGRGGVVAVWGEVCGITPLRKLGQSDLLELILPQDF